MLRVSKSGYYNWLKNQDREPTEREIKREGLKQKVNQFFHESFGTYGSPRIHKDLVAAGYVVSEKTVARLMNELGLRAVPKERYVVTTDSNHNYNIYPNLLDQNFKVEEPNTAWVTDITYVWTIEGWLYLASIIDLYSRKVIGWSMADHMRTELTLKALKMALVTRKPNEGLIHHSDRGSQYCANEYIETLNEIEADISMSRTGNPYDNACMESFHASMKKEFVYRYRFETKEQAKKGITSYMHFYNEKRRHSTIGYVSPNQFERSRLRLEENRSA